MFDNIAPTYDTLNHRLSWNIDKIWRKKAIRQLAPFKPQAILDIATGTGDFAILSAKMLSPKTLVGTDISEKMMDVGKKESPERKPSGHYLIQERRLSVSFFFRRDIRCCNSSIWHTKLSGFGQRFERNVQNIKERWTFEYRGINGTRDISYAPTIQGIFTYDSSYIW